MSAYKPYIFSAIKVKFKYFEKREGPNPEAKPKLLFHNKELVFQPKIRPLDLPLKFE